MTQDIEIREIFMPAKLLFGFSLWRGVVYLGGRWSMPEILQIVAEAYGVDRHDLKSKRLVRKLKVPRWHAMWIMTQQPHLSLSMIGDFFGRHHTTVMNARDSHRASVDALRLEIAA